MISQVERDGRGIKVRNRHWHGRVRSGFWLATAACFYPRGLFHSADSLPYTRWLQRTGRPICITNLLNKLKDICSIKPSLRIQFRDLKISFKFYNSSAVVVCCSLGRSTSSKSNNTALQDGPTLQISLK